VIRIGIFGYGNLAKGVELAVNAAGDMELVAIFTRRAPESVKTNSINVPVVSVDDVLEWVDKIDVMVLCGGSFNDLPQQTPELAKYFNVVDSFDTHARIPEHFANVNASALKAGKVAVISVGWDPGMFSLNRLYASAILPNGKDCTFWGKGVSQGHSDALRRIPGVLDAKQYTIPVDTVLEAVRRGESFDFADSEKHIRECFVVAEEGADLARIEKDIVTMPNYFAGYNTIVHFITAEEMQAEHSGIPHGGFVVRGGTTGVNGGQQHVIEYSLKLDSNPEFTASVLTAYARAAWRLFDKGESGCMTVFDIAPKYLSEKSHADLLKTLL
jgi:diaminopimelate dehydrogenase